MLQRLWDNSDPSHHQCRRRFPRVSHEHYEPYPDRRDTTISSNADINAYLTDGSTPLKYSAFLAAAGGNHQTAMQNAINALYNSGSPAYETHLDLEGAKITLTGPITFTVANGAGRKYIYNGEIAADAAFTGGNFMFVHEGGEPVWPKLRWSHINFDGNHVASWLAWNNGDMLFTNCYYLNPYDGTAPAAADLDSQSTTATFYGYFAGLHDFGTDSAGLWIDHCWFTCEGKGSVTPSSRQQVAIYSRAGDQKILNSTAAAFRHTVIYDSAALMIDGCHFFQGVPGGVMNDHTASIMIRSGYSGSIINNLYLGKSFIEMNLETSDAGETRVGGLTLNGCRAYMESSEPLNVDGNPTRGFIEARARTTDMDGTIKVEDVTIGQTIFMNRGTGAVDVLPTRLFNSGKFNRQAYKGITMRGNGFDGSVLPQANPCTVNAPFTNVNNTGTNGDVDFGNKLPFAARPMAVVSIQPQIKPGGQGGAYETPAVLSISANIVNIGMSAQWSGDCLVTVTGNIESVSGNTFIDG